MCTGVTARWQELPGSAVKAAAVGSGPAVVFANDSGDQPCDWLPLAERLASKGLRVVLFDYSDPSAGQERASVTETLTVARAAAGGKPFALVGASLGGRVVIEAAAQRPAHLAAIVSLSGETKVEDYGDILPEARRVRTPALYVGARSDSLTQGVAQQKALHAAMHGRPNLLLQRSGIDHGTQLIDQPDGPDAATVRSITRFLDQQLR